MGYKKFPLLAATALLLIHWCLGVHEALNQAQTYDEAVHISSGYSSLKSGRYQVDALMNPPLPRLLAALPLLWLNPDPLLGDSAYLQKKDFVYADHFLYGNRVPAEKILHAARIFLFLLLSPLLAWVLFRWTAELGGESAGLAALFFYAFNPTLLANGPLATLDFCAAVFVFLCLYAFSKAIQSHKHPGLLFLLSGLLLGLAASSKHSAIVLAGLLPLTYGAYLYLSSDIFPWNKLVREFLLVLLGAVLCLVLIYHPGQLPLWWEGLKSALAMTQGGKGRIVYLFGQTSVTGWWYYFPLAFLMKNPIPMIVFAALGLGGMYFTERFKNTKAAITAFVVLPAALWMGAACLSRFQIGIRYILPVFPPCCVIAGMGFATLWHAKAQEWNRWSAGVLVLWYGVSALRIHPDYLSYFNEAAGGPDQGYKLLTDSNIDWGQGLKALGLFLAQEKNPPIYLSYFGTADPHAYGIKYVPLAYACDFPRAGDDVEPYRSDKIFFAVSATNLSTAYYRNKDAMKWLDPYEPYKILGHSIFIYDFTHNPEALEHVARILAMTKYPERSHALLRYLRRRVDAGIYPT